jgi:hypothetical protein
MESSAITPIRRMMSVGVIELTACLVDSDDWAAREMGTSNARRVSQRARVTRAVPKKREEGSVKREKY